MPLSGLFRFWLKIRIQLYFFLQISHTSTTTCFAFTSLTSLSSLRHFHVNAASPIPLSVYLTDYIAHAILQNLQCLSSSTVRYCLTIKICRPTLAWDNVATECGSHVGFHNLVSTQLALDRVLWNIVFVFVFESVF